MRLNLNITRKVLLYLLVAGILPLVLLGWLAFEISRGVVIAQAEAEYGRLAGSFTSYMNLYDGQVEDMAASIAGNEAIGRSLQQADAGGASAYDRLEMRVQMGRLLNSYMRIKGLVSIDLFSVGGEHFHVGETLNVVVQRPEVAKALLDEALAGSSPFLWRGVDDNLNANSSQKKVISASRAIHYFSPLTGQSEPVGVLVISLNDEIMRSFLAGLTLAQGVQLMQVDRKGVVSLHSDAARFGQALPDGLLTLLRADAPVREFVLDGESTLLKLHASQNRDHIHVVLAPKRLLVEKINFLALVTLGLILLGLTGTAALTWYFVRVVVQPIRAISGGFGQIQALPDANHHKLPVAGRDADIDALVTGYNNLLDAMTAQREATRELTRAQAERHATETVLLAAMDAIDEAFAVFDANDCLVFCNERFRSTYPGGEAMMLAGTPYETILRAIAGLGHYQGPPEKFERWVQRQLELHRSGDRFSEERLMDGRWLRIVERKTPQGQIVGFRVDITALKRAEAAALAASQAKSSFLATMSHEIRTPMNAILGLLKLLQGTVLTDKQLDYVSKTEGAASSLLGLLNDILDFSKVEAGKMTLDPQPFRIDQFLDDLAVVLSANVGNKELEVLFDIDPELPPLVVGDSTRLRQILINLGGNAVKFTPSGHVVLAIRRSADSAGWSAGTVAIEFAVTDTGIGIAPENQKHIFSGFSQAEASTTRRFGGTGLGLAICKRLVEVMGGDLQLQSTQGTGSTFSFTLRLPVVAPPPPEVADAPHAPQRVLVVDDNPVAQTIMARASTGWGWHTETASSCEEGLALAIGHTSQGNSQDSSQANHGESPTVARFDVYFVDWHMPGQDGWEFTRRLRAWEQENALPRARVIMVTGHGRELLAHRTAEEEAMLDGFLVKPLTASMLWDSAVNKETSDARVRKSSRAGRGQRRLLGLKLLVVEDNLINQQVAEELLSNEGAWVSLAANGQQGVEAVASAKPQFDAVLMDIQMPVLDGYEATRAIRTQLGEINLPVIAMTANAMDSDRQAALDAGMNAHVGKPFELNHLVSVLLGLVPDKAGAAQAADALVAAPTYPEPARQSPASTALSDALRARAQDLGIDIASAVERLGASQTLYARLAGEFVQTLQQAPAQWQAMLDTHDFAQLARELHTLKGLAATLGVGFLSSSAAHAERLCKEAQDPKSATAALQPMAEAVEKATAALRSVGALLAEEATHAQADDHAAPRQEASPDAVRKALAHMLELIDTSDMDVLREFALYRAALETISRPLAARMDAALNALDFPTARALCDEFGRALEETLARA